MDRQQRELLIQEIESTLEQLKDSHVPEDVILNRKIGTPHIFVSPKGCPYFSTGRGAGR